MESGYIYPKTFVVLVAGTMILICGAAAVGAVIPLLSAETSQTSQPQQLGQAEQPSIERVVANGDSTTY
jgi:hypothetical protein